MGILVKKLRFSFKNFCFCAESEIKLLIIFGSSWNGDEFLSQKRSFWKKFKNSKEADFFSRQHKKLRNDVFDKLTKKLDYTKMLKCHVTFRFSRKNTNFIPLWTARNFDSKFRPKISVNRCIRFLFEIYNLRQFTFIIIDSI